MALSPSTKLSYRRKLTTYKNITISDFYQASLEGKLDIIDFREAYEFDYGHVPGAVNLPLSEFEGYEKLLSKDTPYHIICQAGVRSVQACQFLDAQGYDVTNVMEGTGAWPGELV